MLREMIWENNLLILTTIGVESFRHYCILGRTSTRMLSICVFCSPHKISGGEEVMG